jgi:hypothetical protein
MKKKKKSRMDLKMLTFSTHNNNHNSRFGCNFFFLVFQAAASQIVLYFCIKQWGAIDAIACSEAEEEEEEKAQA